MALQWKEKTHANTCSTHTHTWGLQLTAAGLENALQLSSERCGDALTALMELMQIDHVVIFDLCGADCSGGATGLAPAQRWPAFIPTTALKYAVTSCASSWLSLSHYSLEFAKSRLRFLSRRSHFHTDPKRHEPRLERQNDLFRNNYFWSMKEG